MIYIRKARLGRSQDYENLVASLNLIIWMQITASFHVAYLNQLLHTVCGLDLIL